MAKITPEQFYITDLEIKSKILKQLELTNYILAYKFGPYDPEMSPKIEEEIKNGIKRINSKIWDENQESKP